MNNTKTSLVPLANEIVAWLKDYAKKSGRKAWVVGVSGGVDSALVSTLCAMTGLPTHCVILPCQTNPEETVRGINHIVWLQGKFGLSVIKYHRVDLTKTFEGFRNEVNEQFNDNLGYANAKSRLRMIALYHLATCVGGLVVGTGNKIEDRAIGFFTKYGDGGVDISPIGDLMKSEVRQMSRDLGLLSKLSEAVPTDGLWEDGRTDENAIGATYDELEWAWGFLEKNNGWPTDDTIRGYMTARQVEVLHIYQTWHKMTAHKLAPIPVFERSPKSGTFTFEGASF